MQTIMANLNIIKTMDTILIRINSNRIIKTISTKIQQDKRFEFEDF